MKYITHIKWNMAPFRKPTLDAQCGENFYAFHEIFGTAKMLWLDCEKSFRFIYQWIILHSYIPNYIQFNLAHSNSFGLKPIKFFSFSSNRIKWKQTNWELRVVSSNSRAYLTVKKLNDLVFAKITLQGRRKLLNIYGAI